MEKPLSIRVAEALGWREVAKEELRWVGIPPGIKATQCVVPMYEFDAEAMLLVMERLRIGLKNTRDCWVAEPSGDCVDPDALQLYGDGPTILAAVCALILALGAAGKLAA